MTTAYAYARYSSTGQREESITAQLDAMQDYCKRQGINLSRTFVDEAESARFDDRPSFQNMFSTIRINPPDFVLVHKLDRFSRDRYDAAVYRRKLKDHGVRLVSVLEPMDDSPESVILESVLEGMAEYYSKNLAREVMKGMRQTAQSGLWCGGKPPLGYVVDSAQKLAIEPSGAAVVRRIYELFLQGYGYKSIAIKLNEEGYKTAQGGPWYKSSINTILNNERYTGLYIYNQRASASADGSRNGHKHKPVEEQIRIENAFPAIIDRETWNQVKAKMDARKRGPQPRRSEKGQYLLTGLLYCGECGGSIVGSGYRSPGQYFYACTKRSTKACSNPTVSKNWIEDHVLRELKEKVFSDAAINTMVPLILNEIQKRTAGGSDELTAVTKKITEAQTKINRLLDMIEDGSTDPDLKDRLAARRAEINNLRQRENQIKQRAEQHFTEAMVIRFLEDFRSNLESEDPGLKRKTLETFVQRIEVFSTWVEIKFKIEPVDKVGAGKRTRTSMK